MTKAERRKRARQRAKERERAAAATGERVSADEAEGGVAALAVASSFAEPEPAVHQAAVPTESEFITGPVVPRAAGPVRTAPLVPTVRVVTEAGFVDGAGIDEDEDEDDDSDDQGDDDEGDEPMDEQDALFNLACSAVEEGDALSWNEVVTWIQSAEVDDPRLALLTTLLVSEDETAAAPPKLTGDRVLEMLASIGFEEMVAEARETVASSPPATDETPEERELVRTSARELAKQAKRELGGDKPVKASALRAAAQAGRVER